MIYYCKKCGMAYNEEIAKIKKDENGEDFPCCPHCWSDQIYLKWD